MSDWIHKFNTVTERNAATYVEPGVSLTKENSQLEYNKFDVLISGTFNPDIENYEFEITPINNIPLVSIKNIIYRYTGIDNGVIIK